MQITDIERLVEIIRTAKISELVVTAGTPQRTIRLRKSMLAATNQPRRVGAVVSKEAVTPVVQTAAEKLVKSEIYATAPMVGIFHSIDSVSEIGTAVKAGQILGAIESMKLMNDVVSEYDGVIVESFAEDGMPVEYGHKLFRLEQPEF